MTNPTPLKSTQQNISIGEGENLKVFISNGWSPLRSAKKLPTIGKCFATPISFLFGANDNNLQEVIPQALYMLFEQLEENDISTLFNSILEDVWVDGTRKVDIDSDLDNLDELLTLVASVLKQHYGCLIEGKGFLNLFQMIMPLSKAAEA